MTTRTSQDHQDQPGPPNTCFLHAQACTTLSGVQCRQSPTSANVLRSVKLTRRTLRPRTPPCGECCSPLQRIIRTVFRTSCRHAHCRPSAVDLHAPRVIRRAVRLAVRQKRQPPRDARDGCVMDALIDCDRVTAQTAKDVPSTRTVELRTAHRACTPRNALRGVVLYSRSSPHPLSTRSSTWGRVGPDWHWVGQRSAGGGGEALTKPSQ
jgi:hypothetical protein